ncbi:hypothetical protein AURDEDRAFT_186410 [Auricularia subglabra TFB-10046 SS5]|nr:hypothetical protein AURDEDRAFT_186410 [Auricularia subglabra TFB-10046 SS5]
MASPHHRTRRSPTPTALMGGNAGKPSSPDPIKDAILSASGTGWSPLRIAKRDSPSPTPAPSQQQPGSGKKQGLGRRQSSSYNHVRNSHLVSNSPFKSDGPSGPIGARYRPSPSYKGLDVLRRPGQPAGATGRKASGSGEQRRVSAERRAKSYENDRPGFPGSSGRRVSKGQQKAHPDQQRSVLAERKPVVEPLTPELTDNGADKDDDDNVAMEVDIAPVLDLPRPATPPGHAAPDSLHGKNTKSIPSLSPAPEVPASRIPVPSNSPTKSSLVSKRLLGPRSISNSSNESAKRRRRRKTVTFDPRCDVVEFSADEMSEDDDYDDYGDDNEDDTDYMDTDEHEHHGDDTNANCQGDLDGFVESILAQDMPRSPPLHTPDTEAAPVLSADAEDGVPYGRTHHADRVLQHRQSVMKALEQSPSADISLDSADTETENGVPYGRSHHAERARHAHEEERQADALPGSPSPGRTLRESHYAERLLPPVELPVPAAEERVYALDEDPFAEPSASDFGVGAFGLNETNGSFRSPRISREEVMRRLQTRRTGVIDSDSASRERSQTPTGSPAYATTSGSARAATPGSARRHDKPLPIAPGPPMISVPGLNFEGDVSLSDSLNFDLPKSDEGHSFQEMDVSLPQDDEGPQSAIIHQSALDELMRGVEREMQQVERARSPDLASSIGTGTPALDGQYTTTEAEETDVPATPADLDFSAKLDAGLKQPNLLNGAFTDSRDVSSSVEMDIDTPEVPQLQTPELAHKPSLHEESHPPSTHDGLLAIPEPSSWMAQGARVNKSSNGSVRSEASSVRSGESQIAKRAASIRQKKREKRESEGRPRPRRSMSVADAEDLMLEPQSPLLPSPVPADEVIGPSAMDIPLSESIDNELRRRMPPGANGRKYRMREASSVVYAADDKVVHAGAAGDVDSGRAWKTIRRPSDMNEYARQIREMRNADKTGKAYGKVFVRVVGIKGLAVPVPSQPTFFTCTLNNGIHFVTTPECKLAKECKVDQEFELIEHSKLEFTLTIKVRRDAHLQPPPAPRAAPPPPVPTASHSKVSGMLAFFGGGSPKKARAGKERSGSPAPVQVPPPPQPEGLAKYLKSDGTLARVFVNFADIASRCDTKLFETGFKMVGAKLGGEAVVLGELVLQVFRLPALPSVPSADLPQSLEECHRGLRHVNWHKQTYFEGTLTQIGGDCTSWRRRQFRVVGGSLVAYNDVTKKITAKIDLKHAVSVHDDDADAAALNRRRDSADALFQIERSFRIKFGPGEEICFYADSELEKEQWLEVLNALVGHIPPNPLWAEMVWQRQHETQHATPAGRSR